MNAVAFLASYHSGNLYKNQSEVGANDDSPDFLREKCTELFQAEKTEGVCGPVVWDHEALNVSTS